jgi:hypothetical protein
MENAADDAGITFEGLYLECKTEIFKLLKELAGGNENVYICLCMHAYENRYNHKMTFINEILCYFSIICILRFIHYHFSFFHHNFSIIIYRKNQGKYRYN